MLFLVIILTILSQFINIQKVIIYLFSKYFNLNTSQDITVIYMKKFYSMLPQEDFLYSD
jgi:hypothetical protein